MVDFVVDAPVQFCVCLLEPRLLWSKVCMFFCRCALQGKRRFSGTLIGSHAFILQRGFSAEAKFCLFVIAGWAQKWLILLYAPVQFCVCLLEPRLFWSKVCMFFCRCALQGKRRFSGTLIGSHTFILQRGFSAEAKFCLFVCAGWAQKWLILLYAPVQFCVCLPHPRHCWSKLCMFLLSHCKSVVTAPPPLGWLFSAREKT